MNEKQDLDLRFRVENMGVIKQGEFTQKPLTIFCGPNNRGKTWTMYSLWHFYRIGKFTRHQLEEEKRKSSNGIVSVNQFNDLMSNKLGELFNISQHELKGARFKFVPKGKQWGAWQQWEDDVFLIPTERNGLHLFYRELSTRRTALLHHASKEKINIHELLKDVIRSRYAKPIADYINWLNQLTEYRGRSDFHDFSLRLQKDLVGGKYNVDHRSGDITFKPYQIKRDRKKTQTMKLHLTSGTVKSLFGLWFYLEYNAEPGDVLMIDEPELNIHPQNQRRIARFLARLVNAGLRVAISTHSDYIVREFNSLIMLSRDENGALQKKHKYTEDEILKPEQVGAYLFDEQNITSFEITPDDGIYASTFDEVIRDLNEVNDNIYYSLRED